jgi:hypothetical protein
MSLVTWPSKSFLSDVAEDMFQDTAGTEEISCRYKKSLLTSGLIKAHQGDSYVVTNLTPIVRPKLRRESRNVED